LSICRGNEHHCELGSGRGGGPRVAEQNPRWSDR
jgi:hypothetical protein